MSEVTTIILHIDSLCEPEDQKAKEINEYFTARARKGLVYLEDRALPARWYGGEKFVEAELYVGAYNYLDLNEFCDFVRNGVTWNPPVWVQLWVKGPYDSKFATIDLVELPDR